MQEFHRVQEFFRTRYSYNKQQLQVDVIRVLLLIGLWYSYTKNTWTDYCIVVLPLFRSMRSISLSRANYTFWCKYWILFAFLKIFLAIPFVRTITLLIPHFDLFMVSFFFYCGSDSYQGANKIYDFLSIQLAPSTQVSISREVFESLKERISQFEGNKGSIDSLSLEECEKLEQQLKKTLTLIEARKIQIQKDLLESEKEQRLCVICQDQEKSVVLLPCRHLCLCQTCSSHQQLTSCPLCREAVSNKISVFN